MIVNFSDFANICHTEQIRPKEIKCQSLRNFYQLLTMYSPPEVFCGFPKVRENANIVPLSSRT
jgi:hypothetical protein